MSSDVRPRLCLRARGIYFQPYYNEVSSRETLIHTRALGVIDEEMVLLECSPNGINDDVQIDSI